MHSSRKTIIDFDGTLVYENSSRVLEEVVFERWTGPIAGTTKLFYRGHLAIIGLITFKILYRLTRRDGRLLLLLLLARPLFKTMLPDITQATARRLHLNPNLGVDYKQPFTILSTGLEPIIQAFLKLHPKLACQDILSSQFSAGAHHYSIHLRPIHFKVGAMRSYNPDLYLTDHHHEALILQANLDHPYQINTLQLPDTHPIYRLIPKA